MALKKDKVHGPWVKAAFLLAYAVFSALLDVYAAVLMSQRQSFFVPGMSVLTLSAAPLFFTAAFCLAGRFKPALIACLAPGAAVFAAFALFVLLSVAGIAPRVEQVVPADYLPFAYFLMARSFAEFIFLLGLLGKLSVGALADNLWAFLTVYAAAFAVKVLLVENYQIPSQSMVPNLLVKDTLMVEKMTYGSYIPLFGLKLPRLARPLRNDIIVFVSPAWKSPGLAREIISFATLSIVNLDNTFDTPKNLVKRLVGLPGDTLSMSNRVLYVNGRPVVTDYLFSAKEEIIVREERYGDPRPFRLYAETLDNRTRIVQRFYPDEFSGRVAPDNREGLIFNFSEIRVPRKGETVRLSGAGAYFQGLMRLLIERESGRRVELSEGRFYLDGAELKEWRVADDYYFGMGDNRDWSEDSRYFGFIPGRNIFGRPFLRYFPFNRAGFDLSGDTNSIRRQFAPSADSLKM